jgi:probable HAF family extracellular repeat protein
MQDLGTLGGDLSEAYGVSADGAVVVGRAKNASGQWRAFWWTAKTGMQDLGTLPGYENASEAYGVSAGGAVVVGTASAGGNEHAFRWTVQSGMQDLNKLYANLLQNGSVLGEATAISPDGRYIVGTGINAATKRTEAYLLKTCEDTDQDYICDEWERNGLDINGDGRVDLDLPALGARVGQRDIFVEYDAMQGMAPSQAAINAVVEAFWRAPGKLPFALHVQDGGDLTIPRVDTLNIWQGFDNLKAQYFGTPAERNDPNWANIRRAKRLVFRYCLFAVRHNIHPRSSGIAELPGDDFVVTLGSQGWQNFRNQLVANPNPPLTWDNVVAGTFMHELGHTLRLRHGGGDRRNYKPNYHSVMNYLWQMPERAYSRSWVLDYSRQAFNTLDENALSEPAGIGGHTGHRLPINRGFVPERGAVDWNQDRDTTDLNVARDINRDDSLSVLNGYDDWSNIDLRHGINWLDGMHIKSMIRRELTPPALLQAGSGHDWIMEEEEDSLQEMTYEMYQELASLNSPPSAVEVTKPAVGAVVSPTPEFVLRATDAEGDSLLYILELRNATDTLLWETGFAAAGAVAQFTLPDTMALAGGVWEYRVRAMDWKTALGYWSQWRAMTVEVSDVEEGGDGGFELWIEPQPPSESARVHYRLRTTQPVRVWVVDLLGRTVAVLVEGVQPAGTQSVPLPQLAAGVYTVVVRTGHGVAARQFVVTR